LKNINAIAHFTDWIVSHVHVGALGWNGFLTFAMLYWIVPKIFNTNLYSRKAANTHFWIATLGIILYAIPMYFSGYTQGLMWKEFTEEGLLRYGNFLDTTIRILPMHMLRALGGFLYWTGAIIMAWNLIKTAKSGQLIKNEAAEAYPLTSVNEPVSKDDAHWHRWIERRPIQMVIASLVMILIGTIFEFVPMFLVKSNVKTIESVKPYTPLELEGRDLYIREGCNNCHSQLVRPFRSETERYGEYSKSGEYVYDHPFLWGSKRTGPDLAREGNKTSRAYKSAAWHFQHMKDPNSTSPRSIMPKYDWFYTSALNTSQTEDKINAMRTLGVDYPKGYEKMALADLKAQAQTISDELKKEGLDLDPEAGIKLEESEIVALIAYLQKLGRDIKPESKTTQLTK
jgi:cytochrome c oxidase cbb3-type subunit I/II